MNISKNFLSGLRYEGKEACYFDDTLKGFGVRVGKSSISYIVMYRNAYGKQRKMTICKTDRMTPAEARNEAKKILADVVQGKDPQTEKDQKRKERTVEDLAIAFLKECKVRIKQTTFRGYLSVTKNQIIPMLGKVYLKELHRSDVQMFYNDMISGKMMRYTKHNSESHKYIGGANQARKTLHTMFEFGIRNEWVEHNPVDRVQSISTPRRKAFLKESDVVRFGEVLANTSCRNPSYKKFLKLILLTGCRKNEIAKLTWQEVDFENQLFRFKDTKTGPQNRPFGKSAKELLLEMRGEIEAIGRIFPTITGGNIQKFVQFRIVPQMKIDGFCIHALRHTFASMAAALGYSDNIIAGMLGHHLNTITNRYTHLTDKPLIEAADIVSKHLEQLFNKGVKTTEKEQCYNPARKQRAAG